MDVDQVGRKLFGRTLRLEVLLWVHNHEDGTFFQGEVQRALQRPQGNIASELERLIELDMLIRHERSGGSSRQYYSRRDQSTLWAVAQAVDDALAARGLDEPRASAYESEP